MASDNTDDVPPCPDNGDADARDQLDIRLPERCNLRLHVTGDGFCSVDISSKLEGDVDITLDHGDIQVNKIRSRSRHHAPMSPKPILVRRGPNVNFHTNRGAVHVKTVAEGTRRSRASGECVVREDTRAVRMFQEL